MHGKNKNNLIVIENGQLSIFALDDKLSWEIGRPSKDNMPDIKLRSTTVSRKHGKFQNMDGIWFYVDYKGKNGTVYNDRHIKAGLNGRVKPIILQDGDIFIFGGGEEAVISSKTIWAMYSQKEFDGRWRVEDTRGLARVVFQDGTEATTLEKPSKGTVVEKEKGIAIYMGDNTYLFGDIAVIGN